MNEPLRIESAPTGEPSDEPFRRSPATWACCAMVGLIAIFWFAKNNTDADLWGHIKYGEDLLQSGALPITDPYSYTAGDRRWMNHEIAAEIALALLFRVGNVAIQAWKTILGALTLGLAFGMSRKERISLPAWLFLCAMVVSGLANGWAPRPQVFSYAFFAALLAILTAGERRLAWLWLAPPLLAAWVNFHGGFLFGLGSLGVFLGMQMVDEWRRRGFARPGAFVVWTAVGLSALAATLLNPYGWRMYVGLVDELGIQRPQVAEWRPVAWRVSDIVALDLSPAQWLILLTAFCLCLNRRPMSWARRVLLVVIAIETQLHVRHVPFLSISALAWLPGAFQDSLDRVWGWISGPSKPREPAEPSAPLPSWPFAVAFSFGATLALVGIGVHLSTIRVERNEYPVDALRFLAEEKIDGKMVVPFKWAQYVIYARYPEILVSWDGRYGTVYDARLLDWNFDLWYPNDPAIRFRDPDSGAVKPGRIFDYLDPDLALVDRQWGWKSKRGEPGETMAEAILRERGDWTLLYEDGLAAIYGRARRFGDPAGDRYLPPERRRVSSATPAGWTQFPAVP